MKKSELKQIIKECIKSIMNENIGPDSDKNPLYVEYVSERKGENPFVLGGQKYQYVNAKYPNGKIDIGVYAFSGDVVYGYDVFRKIHNNC